MDIKIYSKDFSKDLADYYTPHFFNLPKIPCDAAIITNQDISDKDYNILRDRLIDKTGPLADKLLSELNVLVPDWHVLAAANSPRGELDEQHLLAAKVGQRDRSSIADRRQCKVRVPLADLRCIRCGRCT
jgi:hypothetical protein